MQSVTIYTDGSCLGNPGVGGWAAIIIGEEEDIYLSGREDFSTNQRMEIMAVIGGLSALQEPCDVTVYSDSAYVVNAFNNGWIDNWLKSGWVNSQRKPVANRGLWEELVPLTQKHNVKFVKVKGHSSNKYNNKCDELARNAAMNGWRLDGEEY